MKFKSLYSVFVIILIALFAVSCDDTLEGPGFTVQPPDDRREIGLDTLELLARTLQMDSIYAKTRYPVLGEYTDPVFGTIKSEYIGEFYFPEGTGFADDAAIDSVRVQLAYTTMMGDSLSPMGLSVYEVTESLKGVKNYSNIDPKEYADMSAPLGTQIFTGRNSTYRTETSSSGSSIRVYEINVKLPKDIGDKFLTEYKKENHGKLVDPDKFREFFPGLYFTTDFGKSTIISVSLTSLMVHYKYTDKGGSSTGQDTIRTTAMSLNITPEVTQINHIENKNDQLLYDTDYAYVKSPAGVTTEITFPFSEQGVHEKLKSQALNLADLTIPAIPETDEGSMVKLSPPTYLLLVHKDSLDGFFEKKKLTDQVTSFIGKFDTSTYSYSFGNISTMVNYYNEKHKEKPTEEFKLVYCLIPVDVTFVTNSYGQTTTTPMSIYNQIWPSAVRLDKREGNLKLDMIFSNLTN
ncbi:DUF4270 domain-containing protein [Proteiniphilum sp. UBA5384]|uniref:DUF4270 domain-containing protein n=1 Tax=Proteiniphilum sp. UBA5384 TaxID=1947279 RepID=UPI0026001DFA|nr:DUF4270 domain-containing protein [Proteiniphilum sp. UBA5384]